MNNTDKTPAKINLPGRLGKSLPDVSPGQHGMSLHRKWKLTCAIPRHASGLTPYQFLVLVSVISFRRFNVLYKNLILL